MTALPPPFTYRRVVVNGVGINVAVAGDGEPLLLLHGYPQTHLTWIHIAPALAEKYTVVVSDLRGYGDSDKPAPDSEHRVYSKRSMADDQIGVMRELGFDQFHLVGHDRGGRVGHRLALDYPDAVLTLTLLDILPTRYMLKHVDQLMASVYFHWFFLAARAGIPERLLGADPEFWIRTMSPRTGLKEQVLADYIRCFSDPATIAATCSDYRADSLTDLADDDASAEAGEVVSCPTLILWGAQSLVGTAYDPVQIWREYAPALTGHGVECGHFLPEEAPEAVLSHLETLLSKRPTNRNGIRELRLR